MRKKTLSDILARAKELFNGTTERYYPEDAVADALFEVWGSGFFPISEDEYLNLIDEVLREQR